MMMQIIILTSIICQIPIIIGAIYGFYGAFRDFSSTTSYVASVVGTYSWRAAANAVGTSRWWILSTSTVDSTLTVETEHLDAADAVGISSSRVADAMGTSSNWRATIDVGARIRPSPSPAQV
jgi:hypothetical protein